LASPLLHRSKTRHLTVLVTVRAHPTAARLHQLPSICYSSPATSLLPSQVSSQYVPILLLCAFTSCHQSATLHRPPHRCHHKSHHSMRPSYCCAPSPAAINPLLFTGHLIAAITGLVTVCTHPTAARLYQLPSLRYSLPATSLLPSQVSSQYAPILLLRALTSCHQSATLHWPPRCCHHMLKLGLTVQPWVRNQLTRRSTQWQSPPTLKSPSLY
jgi:hypothetical protein